MKVDIRHHDVLSYLRHNETPNSLMRLFIEEHLIDLGILHSKNFYLQLQKFDDLPYLAAKMWLQHHFLNHNENPQDWHLALQLLKKKPVLASEKYFEGSLNCFLRPFCHYLKLGYQQEVLEEVLAHCPDAKSDVAKVFEAGHSLNLRFDGHALVSLMNMFPEIMTSRSNWLARSRRQRFVLLEYLFHWGYDERTLAIVAEQWPTEMTSFHYARFTPLLVSNPHISKARWKVIENILPHLDHFTCDLWPFSWRAIRQALRSLSDTSFCQLQSLRISLPAFDARAMNSLKQIFENKYHALQKICLSANARVGSVELVNKATLRIITEAIASARSKAGWRLDELTLEYFLLPVSLIAADATRCLTVKRGERVGDRLYSNPLGDCKPHWELTNIADEANRCPIGSLVLVFPWISRLDWVELWDEIASKNMMEKICLSSFIDSEDICSAMSRVSSLTCLRYLVIDDRATYPRIGVRGRLVWSVSVFEGFLKSFVRLLSKSGQTLEYLRLHLPILGTNFSRGERSLLLRNGLASCLVHCAALKYLSLQSVLPGAVAPEALLEVMQTKTPLEFAEIHDRKFHFTATPTIALRSGRTVRRKCVFCNHEATDKFEAVLWRNREIKPRTNQLRPQDGEESLLVLIEMLLTSDSRLFKYTELPDQTDLFEAALASSKSQKELQKLEAKHDLGAGNEPSPAPAALTVLWKARSEAVGDLTELLKLVRRRPKLVLTARSRYLESLSVRYELLRHKPDMWCLPWLRDTRRSPRKQRSSTYALHVSS